MFRTLVLQAALAQQEMGLQEEGGSKVPLFGWCVLSSCCDTGARCLEDSNTMVPQRQKAKVKLFAES